MLRWLSAALRGKNKGAAPQAPGVDLSMTGNATIYAVGDVHGRLDLLRAVEDRIAADIPGGENAIVLYLGDMIDRGPESSGVLEHLRQKQGPGFVRLCLRGNHDDVFLSFLERPLAEWGWLDMGGRETLRSYGLMLDPFRDRSLGHEALVELLNTHVPQSHRQFLAQTPFWARRDDFLFVHAGIQPGIQLDRQDPMDFLWIREPFLSQGPQLPLTVVHGHTPGASIAYGQNRIGIDTGAYATGRLSVLKVSGGAADEFT
jgi:serine/threonine protein phosphatase 1